jgi:hypothetical protein
MRAPVGVEGALPTRVTGELDACVAVGGAAAAGPLNVRTGASTGPPPGSGISAGGGTPPGVLPSGCDRCQVAHAASRRTQGAPSEVRQPSCRTCWDTCEEEQHKPLAAERRIPKTAAPYTRRAAAARHKRLAAEHRLQAAQAVQVLRSPPAEAPCAGTVDARALRCPASGSPARWLAAAQQ